MSSFLHTLNGTELDQEPDFSATLREKTKKCRRTATLAAFVRLVIASETEIEDEGGIALVMPGIGMEGVERRLVAVTDAAVNVDAFGRGCGCWLGAVYRDLPTFKLRLLGIGPD